MTKKNDQMERINDPGTFWAHLRKESPVLLTTDWDNKSPIWDVSQYDDVQFVLKNHELFESNWKKRASKRKLLNKPSIEEYINNHLAFKDPPDHTRLRGLIGKVFTPKFTAELEPVTQRLADDLLDAVADKGNMDIIMDYALPLPSAIIGKMLGVPALEQGNFKIWADVYLNIFSGSEYNNQIRQFIEYWRPMIADRKINPQNDLLSHLVQAEEYGDRLSESELYSMIFFIFLAGHETTTNLIANGTLLLLQHPEMLGKIRLEPSLMANAIEEILRYEGPVVCPTVRVATKDVEIHGQLIKRGEMVRVSLGSAGRDESVFDVPQHFNVSRSPNPHMAFGYGIHYCLGASLSRMEGRVALNALIRKLPDLQLAVSPDEIQWHPSFHIRRLQKLPVYWRLTNKQIDTSDIFLLHEKIDSIIDYLIKAQLPDGSFRTLQTFGSEIKRDEKPAEFSGWYHMAGTMWAASIILYHLSAVQDPRLDQVRKLGGKYLESIIENGLVRMIPFKQLCPLDVDDTAMVFSTLRKYGYDFRSNDYILYANMDDKGGFYEWILPRKKHLKYPGMFLWLLKDYVVALIGHLKAYVFFSQKDKFLGLLKGFYWSIKQFFIINREFRSVNDTAINANALLYFGIVDKTKAVLDRIVQQVIEDQLVIQYYPDKISVYFQVARLYDAGVHELAVVKDQIVDYIARRQKSNGDVDGPIATVLAALTLMYFGAWNTSVLKKAMDFLLNVPMYETGWRPFPATNTIEKTIMLGAPELTATFYLEALYRYKQHIYSAENTQ